MASFKTHLAERERERERKREKERVCERVRVKERVLFMYCHEFSQITEKSFLSLNYLELCQHRVCFLFILEFGVFVGALFLLRKSERFMYLYRVYFLISKRA